MAAPITTFNPTHTADVAQLPRPPEPNITTEAKTSRPPPPPAEPHAPAPAPKKRKLEEAGFHSSPYYKIREAVADLRTRFLQVCQATDFRNSDAPLEILKEIKVVVELSKKMRLDLSTAAEFARPLDKPAVGYTKDEPAGRIPSGEKNRVPQTGQAAILPNNMGKHAPLKLDNSMTTAQGLLVGVQQGAKPSEITNYATQLDEHVQRSSYVIGGSPMGWNFLLWPGSKVVSYGLTKAE